MRPADQKTELLFFVKDHSAYLTDRYGINNGSSFKLIHLFRLMSAECAHRYNLMSVSGRRGQKP